METNHCIELSTGTVLKPSPAVAWQRMGDRVVVLDIPSRSLIGLNQAASILWETLGAGKADLGAGVQSLAEQLDQDNSAVASDVVEFARELFQRQLVVSGDADGVSGQPPHHPGDRPLHASEAEPASDPPPYQKPAVDWEERLEESGVYAACAKDPFLGPNPEQCAQAPQSFAS